MLSHVRAGDTIIVHSLDRLGRNLGDLCVLVSDLNSRGVGIRFIKQNLTFTGGGNNATDKLLLHLLGAVAEFERSLIKERQLEGIAIAKNDRTKYRGGQRKLTTEQAGDLRKRFAAGESKAAIARAFGISRQTVYMYAQG
jgi:DNA invertase Pin-like site-specific DNA recombinase